MDRYVSPIDDRRRSPIPFAARPSSLDGLEIVLLDILKPKGDRFLDQMEALLRDRHQVSIRRLSKPTFTRPAPPDVLSEAERSGAVLVALAD